jgi:hypothetical protein
MRGAVGLRREGGDRPPRKFRESETVVTTGPVECEGRVLPPGSEGTIIDVSPVEGNFAVEFFSPFHCVAFLGSSQIASG